MLFTSGLIKQALVRAHVRYFILYFSFPFFPLKASARQFGRSWKETIVSRSSATRKKQTEHKGARKIFNPSPLRSNFPRENNTRRLQSTHGQLAWEKLQRTRYLHKSNSCDWNYSRNLDSLSIEKFTGCGIKSLTFKPKTHSLLCKTKPGKLIKKSFSGPYVNPISNFTFAFEKRPR